MAPFFEGMGHPFPLHTNPAEFILELVNVDFAQNQEFAIKQLDDMQDSWESSANSTSIATEIVEIGERLPAEPLLDTKDGKAGFSSVVAALVHRAFIKSYRDVFAMVPEWQCT
jgi:hypothetical protein